MTTPLESITAMSEELSAKVQEEFEAWYKKEEKGMPPFDEFTKQALHAMSKLAYLTGYVSAADYIAHKLGV